MSVWVMPSVDVYENFLKRSQAVAGGRRRSQAVGTPNVHLHLVHAPMLGQKNGDTVIPVDHV